MKILTLVRHAKSSWNDPDLADFDRPLNERGERDAPVMGERLASAEPRPALVVSSPAVRARTTAEVIAEAIGYPPEDIVFRDEIYEASVDELLALVRGFSDLHEHVFVIGHNPGFTDLANELANAHIDNVPTCGVARIRFEVEAWSAIERLEGELVDFDYPKRAQ